MCLTFNQIKPTHQGTRSVWKILKLEDRVLKSRFFNHYTWKSGLNRSIRTKTKLSPKESIRQIVEYGFHVYTSKEVAQNYISTIEPDGAVIVEMTVESCDFVAESTRWHEAVYTKTTIAPEEFERVITCDTSF